MTLSGTARRLFWRYLFPVVEHLHDQVPKVMLNRQGRERLYEIIFELVKQDEDQFRWLFEDLRALVPFDREDDGKTTLGRSA